MTLTEFVPPKTRGRWLSFMAFIVVAGFPATAIFGYLIIPHWGGPADVHHRRHRLFDRMVPTQGTAGIAALAQLQGRAAEAEALMTSIEEAASPTLPLPAPAPTALQLSAADMFKLLILQRLIVGSWVLITINTLIFGFVIFLPQFFLRQGLTITNSLAYTLVLSIASLIGCALGAWSSDAIGRRRSIIGASIATIAFGGHLCRRFNAASDPAIVLSIGFVLIVAIYVQTAILFGVYTPELFPTEIRLRANGICNTLGRGATVISPFVVGALIANYKLPGVVWLMIGLVVIQIIVVWALGVEPRNRALEDVAVAKA